MGLTSLLKHVVAWPVTGTAYVIGFSMRQARGMAIRELTDDDSIREELMELQLQLDMGEIGEDEYVEREAELMRRFREVREWRDRLGLPVRGAIIGVPGDERDTGPAAGEAEFGHDGGD